MLVPGLGPPVEVNLVGNQKGFLTPFTHMAMNPVHLYYDNLGDYFFIKRCVSKSELSSYTWALPNILRDPECPGHSLLANFMEQAGINNVEWVYCDGRIPDIVKEEYDMSNNPFRGNEAHPIITHDLRELLLPSAEPQGLKHIYIKRPPRSDRPNINLGREIHNEDKLLDYFRAQGLPLTVVRPETIPAKQQLGLFVDAELVIGSGGSAFVHTIVCCPGTRIVSLRKGGQRSYSLALQVGLDWRGVWVKPVDVSDDRGPLIVDVKIAFEAATSDRLKPEFNPNTTERLDPGGQHRMFNES